MAITRTNQGFALLVAVIFMSVMLTFGLALGSLAYKQQVLASAAVDSQYAFYAADAGLECILYTDQQEASFSPFPSTEPTGGELPSILCDGAAVGAVASVWNSSQWELSYQIPLDASSAYPRCADVTVYKYSSAQPDGSTTYLFSQGYNISCARLNSEISNPTNGRFSSRGISAHY